MTADREDRDKSREDGRHLPTHAVKWLVVNGMMCRGQHPKSEACEYEPGPDMLIQRAEAAEQGKREAEETIDGLRKLLKDAQDGGIAWMQKAREAEERVLHWQCETRAAEMACAEHAQARSEAEERAVLCMSDCESFQLELHKARAEVAQLRAERDHWKGLNEARLLSAGPDEGGQGFTMWVRDPTGVMAMMAESLAREMDKQGAENYLTYGFMDSKNRRLELTARWHDGLTPAEKNAKLEAQLSDAQAEIERLLGERDEARKIGRGEVWEQAQRRVEVLEKALRKIAEGNLGPASWQADYGRIRDVAEVALQGTEPQPEEKR